MRCCEALGKVQIHPTAVGDDAFLGIVSALRQYRSENGISRITFRV